MPLRVLAGPFPLVDDAGQAAVGDVNAPGRMLAYPDTGLIISLNNALNRLALDGIFCNNADIDSNVGSGSVWGYSMVSRSMLWLKDNVEFTMEPHALCPIKGPAVSPTFSGSMYVRLKDRLIQGGFQRVLTSTLAGTGSTAETIIGSAAGTTLDLVGPGRKDGEAFFGCSETHQFFFYDTANKKVASTFYVLEPCLAFVYVPDYNIVVGLTGSKTATFVKIWEMAVLPVTLSAPTLFSGKLQGGSQATFRVRVLGGASEPCAGEVVGWSSTGVGTMIDTTTTTDADGYATAKIQFGTADVGSVTINVSVVVS